MPASCVAWPSTAIALAPADSFPGEDLDGVPSIEDGGIGAAALSDGTNRDTCFRMIRCSSLFVTPDLQHHQRRGKKKANAQVVIQACPNERRNEDSKQHETGLTGATERQTGRGTMLST